MIQCKSCDRHFRSNEASCPFCGSAAPASLGVALKRIAQGASMVILAACYGPSVDKWETGGCLDTDGTACDEDGDGYLGSIDDCDDANPAINPGVAEVCDDTLDNDCDGLIDLDDSADCVVSSQ